MMQHWNMSLSRPQSVPNVSPATFFQSTAAIKWVSKKASAKFGSAQSSCYWRRLLVGFCLGTSSQNVRCDRGGIQTPSSDGGRAPENPRSPWKRSKPSRRIDEKKLNLMFSKRDKQMSEIWAVLLSELAMKGFAAFVCLFPPETCWCRRTALSCWTTTMSLGLYFSLLENCSVCYIKKNKKRSLRCRAALWNHIYRCHLAGKANTCLTLTWMSHLFVAQQSHLGQFSLCHIQTRAFLFE